MPLSPRPPACARVAWRRQRNNRLGLMSCRRATADTLALALRDNRRLRIGRPAPTRARPGDDLDTLKRVGAVFDDRRKPILLAIFTTILRHCDLATNHSARSS